MINGNCIFTGNAKALLCEFDPERIINEDTIVFLDSLTTEAAYYIIRNPIIGIITEQSSFATHGANILRVFIQNSSRKIVWVSGVRRESIICRIGESVQIYEDGTVAFSDDKNHDYVPKETTIRYSPLNRKVLIEYNLSSKSYNICYWPNRPFIRLSYSIIKDGLLNNLKILKCNDYGIFQTKEGIIWFKNAPFLKDLINLARNMDYSNPILSSQIKMYDSLSTSLKGDLSLLDLANLYRRYFSEWLLFHNTYEYLLIDIYHLFCENLNTVDAYKAMNKLMSCKVDAWMLEQTRAIQKSKNILTNELPIALPDFSIYEDIEITTNCFFKYLLELGYSSFSKAFRKELEYYIRFFVTKEWKFVLVKAISTRFSAKVRSFGLEKSLDEIAQMELDQLTDLIKAY